MEEKNIKVDPLPRLEKVVCHGGKNPIKVDPLPRLEKVVCHGVKKTSKLTCFLAFGHYVMLLARLLPISPKHIA